MSSLKDAIRKATVGEASKFKSEIVEYNGIKLEIRQPSVKGRQDLLERCMTEEGKIKNSDFIVWGVIYNTFVPGTEETVFEESDFDALMAKPSGSFIDEFGAVAAKLLRPDNDIEKK